MKFLIDNHTNDQPITETKVNLKHSGKLPIQSQQWNHKNNMRKKPKVNNQDIRATSMTSLWCIYCKPTAHNTTRPSVTATDFEQANARWYVNK